MESKQKLLFPLIVLLILSGCNTKKEEVIEYKEETNEIEEIVKLEEDIKYTLFSKLDINEKQPYVFLVNAKENDVYQQFKVYLEDELLWSSMLVEPGKAETLNVYNLLDEGEYELKYLVTSYSLEDKTIVKADVNVNQKIQIEKGE